MAFLRFFPGAALAALLVLGPVAAQESNPTLAERAAAAMGVPSDAIELIAAGRRRAGDGQMLDALKVTMKSTGATVGLYLDASGAVVDPQVFDAASSADRPLFERKTSAMLRDKLTKSAGAKIDVAIWLFTDPEKIDFRSAMQASIDAGASEEDARAEMRARLAATNSATVNDAKAVLTSRGFEIGYADTYAPVIFTTADANDLAMLVEFPFVEQIYPSLEYQKEDDGQNTTHRWDRVQNFGVWGKGVKVAIIEDDGVLATHPDLNVVASFNPNINIGFHATGVAGIIGSTGSFYPGHARGVEIYSGNTISFIDAQILAATSWAIAQGVDVVNMSFGVDSNLALTMLDRFVDYQVRYTATTFVKSAGNAGTTTGNVSSPGLGWNILTVGNFNDNDNPNWDDDVMEPTSSFGNPISTHNDRQKPELAAVGTTVTSTNTSGGYSSIGTGTSYSAPAICGMAACLMQVNPVLKTSPEVVRAVMMAGATHNIEGAARLSDRDGCGGINGLQAYRIVQNQQLAVGTLLPSFFTTTGYYVHTIFLEAGDRARVCLAWNSRVTYSSSSQTYGADVLDADLDIAILPGQAVTTGTVLAVSSSFDNSYEIVEFVPPTTGYYTVRINDFRFDGASESFALAWTQHVDGRYVRFRETLDDVTSTDIVGPCIGNPAFGLHPYDQFNPGASVYCLASAGATTGVALTDGRRLYADLDALTLFALNPAQTIFNGSYGTYAPSFSFSPFPAIYTGYSLNLPDNPALVGYPMYFTALTIDGNAPGSIKEISDVKEVTIQGHATNVALTDDSAAQVNIGFAFPFYGQTYLTCHVGSNGLVTFGGPSTDYTESIADFVAGLPKICVFWDDLNPAAGGLVRTRQAGDQFIIEWVNVPQYGVTSDANSAMLILHQDGRIEMKYLDCSLTDAIVGVSPGGNASVLEVDTTSGSQRGLYGQAVGEQFNGTGANEMFDVDTSVVGSFGSSYLERNTVTFTPLVISFLGYRYVMEVDM